MPLIFVCKEDGFENYLEQRTERKNGGKREHIFLILLLKKSPG